MMKNKGFGTKAIHGGMKEWSWGFGYTYYQTSTLFLIQQSRGVDVLLGRRRLYLFAFREPTNTQAEEKLAILKMPARIYSFEWAPLPLVYGLY